MVAVFLCILKLICCILKLILRYENELRQGIDVEVEYFERKIAYHVIIGGQSRGLILELFDRGRLLSSFTIDFTWSCWKTKQSNAYKLDLRISTGYH